MRVVHQIMYFNVHNGNLLNCIDDNYFISITEKPNDTNRHHLPHCLREM